MDFYKCSLFPQFVFLPGLSVTFDKQAEEGCTVEEMHDGTSSPKSPSNRRRIEVRQYISHRLIPLEMGDSVLTNYCSEYHEHHPNT